MQIYSIQNIQNSNRYPLAQKIRTNQAKPVLRPLASDVFTRNTDTKTPQDISFTGFSYYEKMIIKYMKSKSCKVSMRASKRPYCELDKELSPVTKAIKIPVSMAESINAWDINPNNSKKYVIYLHGFAQNLTSNQPLYKALSKTDFGILAIDYRGYGKNPHTKHFSDNDIVQDVKASIEYLKNKGVKDIGLVGHSFGGYISAKTSNSNKLGFQILVSPMISLEFWLKKVVKFPKRNKKESLFVKYIPSYKNMYSKVFDINEHIRHNLTPTYVIQGRKDAYVRTSKVKEMTKQVPELKEFVVINSSKHRMDNDKISEIVRVLKKL